MTSSRLTPTFIMVPCRCGRHLRAKWDQVGTEIRCWDCQQTTMVVIPRARLRLVDMIFRSVGDLFQRSDSMWLVVLAGLMTMAFSARYVGLGFVAVLLFLVAILYGDVIQNPDKLNSQYDLNWGRIYRGLTRFRLVACLLLAAGTVVPLWLIHAGLRHSPHFTPVSLVFQGVMWVVSPIVMAAAYADLGVPGTKIRARLGFVRAYPLITILVITVVPLMLVGSEAVVAAMIYSWDLLPFFALDYMPVPRGSQVIQGFLYIDGRNFADLPQQQFMRGYLMGLCQGYSFVAGIPPSMSIPTRSGLDSFAIRMNPSQYFSFRLLLVFAISLGVVLGLTIQARCLSILSSANRQRLL